MRQWTERHPNLMVLFWAAACLYAATGIIDNYRDKDWFFFAVYNVALLGCHQRFAEWWRRT
jgi:hypothetical protein